MSSFKDKSLTHGGRIRPGARAAHRMLFGGMVALAVASPAAAATFTLGDGKAVELAPITYRALSYADQSPSYLDRKNQRGTAEFTGPFVRGPGPTAETLIAPTPPSMDPFPLPFNGAATAFSSAKALSDGTAAVGVSGRSIREGALLAETIYEFDITPRGYDMNFLLLSEIPEMEVALIGLESQVGENFLPEPGNSASDDTLQYARARSSLLLEVFDSDGNVMDDKSDYLYWYEASLVKVTADSEFPLGFAFNASTDLQNIFDLRGYARQDIYTEDVLGGLDLARWILEPITVGKIVKIPAEHQARLTFSTFAFTRTPFQGVELSGGEARVGDPFAVTLPTSSPLTFTLLDDPPPPAVPLPAGALLLFGGIGLLAVFRQDGAGQRRRAQDPRPGA